MGNLGWTILALLIFTSSADAHVGKNFHEHRIRLDKNTIVLTVDLAPGEAFALRRCPKGYEGTDLDARTHQGGRMSQKPRRWGWLFRHANSDSLSGRVEWHRTPKDHPYIDYWKPGVADNTGPTGVTFSRYCGKTS